MWNAALICDWLISRGGGERVLEAIYEDYPSPVYTLLHNKKHFPETFWKSIDIHTSFLQSLPFSSAYYRYLLPFYPLAIEQFDLRSYDLILSMSHAVAKGVLTDAQQLHLCYCYTPMRYAWDLAHSYLGGLGRLSRILAHPALHYLRQWDAASANRVDHFAACSHYVARRIKKVYQREATVIYPPVDVDRIPYQEEKEEFYLTISRMVPYKRIDLIVEAFGALPSKRLVVIGDGPENDNIKRKAKKNVEILGHQSDAVVYDYLKRARGFLFAAEEDFGIVVVEAQAAGTPVIAFGRGGAKETVVPEKTGIFFDIPNVDSIIAAVQTFEQKRWNPQQIREHVVSFSKSRFQQEFRMFVNRKWEDFCENRHLSRR